MSERHKWADVIIAFAEGKELQCAFRGSEWRDWKFTPHETPFAPWHCQCEYEWRIKPEKQKFWINIYSEDQYSYFHKSRELADKSAVLNQKGKDMRIACIEIEYEKGQGL